MTEVFPCFFLSCKANVRVKLAKAGQGPHSSTLVVICVVRLFVLFYVLFVCKCVLPPGDNPTAVNKYIISSRTERCMTACHYVLQSCDCVLFGCNVNTNLQNAEQNTVRSVSQRALHGSLVCAFQEA